MSQLNVDNIQNRTGSNGGPNFPSGITVAVGQTAYIHGNLQVDGTETIVNTETLNVADKTVGIGSTSNASNTTADGAGIEVFASHSQTGNNKTITWQNSSSAWTFGGGGIVATDAVVGSAVTINSSGIKAGIITATNGLTVSGNIGLAGANYGASGQVLTSGGAGANASWTTISSDPQFSGIASGSITGGRGVCVADDGKLMGVTGANESTGTSTQIDDATNDFAIVYDESADKYVYFYRDQNNGDKGQARVGTQSGTTITWGAKQQFVANTTEPSQICALYDSTNNKSVVLYRDNANNNKGSVVVCSLSGSTLTFGTPVTDITEQSGSMEYNSFCYCPGTDHYAIVYNNSTGNKGNCRIGKYTGTNSSTWPNGSVEFLPNGQARGTGCFYDTTANKLCVMAHHGGDGNAIYIWAGTIASDAVTFGTLQQVDANNSDGGQLTGTHDSTTGKNILCYPGAGFVGKCKVATLSGTTFTFGAEYTFGNTSAAANRPVIAYGASPKKFLVSYADAGASQQVYSTIGSVSGTTITFQTPYNFQTNSNGDTAVSAMVYNPDTASFVSVFRSLTKGAYFVQNIRVSNITKGNYVGIANASYTDGQTASTALPGAVNTAVSGLTVGQKYYVVADGTLNTTADSENIDAGNAIATNKLLVR